MISGETICCRKIRRIFRYHVTNKPLSPKKFAHRVMLLFFLFRDEKKLLSGSPPLYQSKLQQQGVQGVINRNKIKFEPYDDLIDQAFSQFNENLINNQDPHSQADETPEAEYPNENHSDDTFRISSIPNIMPQILPNDEIAKGANFLIQSKGKYSIG